MGKNKRTNKKPYRDSIEGKDPQKTPLPLKILAVLLIAVAALAVPALVIVIVAMVMDRVEFVDYLGVMTFIIASVQILALFINAVGGFIFGINLLRNKRRNARLICEVLIVATILSMLCELMLEGLTFSLLTYAIRFTVLIILATYIDPALSQERKVQRQLHKQELRDEAEDGTLGRDETGKGYIKLNFFNIFWIFLLGCVVGIIIETIYYAIFVGGYQNRAGMLYGPFSPIYGFGAVLMTAALNRMYNKNILIVFLLSALIGGVFEYAVSWFMEFAFGIVAWDYTGSFLSFDGRTNAMYMFFWGILGCVWVKLLLPYVLKLVNFIPWNWRYSLTTVAALFMIVDGVLTLAAYDSWYQRQAGVAPTNALEEFCNAYYDDEFMEQRFQTMTIDPDRATRT